MTELDSGLGPALPLLVYVLSTFPSCLDRQVQEAVNITQDHSNELLNSKSEYHQPSLTRVTTTKEVAVRQRGSV